MAGYMNFGSDEDDDDEEQSEEEQENAKSDKESHSKDTVEKEISESGKNGPAIEDDP